MVVENVKILGIAEKLYIYIYILSIYLTYIPTQYQHYTIV